MRRTAATDIAPPRAAVGITDSSEPKWTKPVHVQQLQGISWGFPGLRWSLVRWSLVRGGAPSVLLGKKLPFSGRFFPFWERPIIGCHDDDCALQVILPRSRGAT